MNRRIPPQATKFIILLLSTVFSVFLAACSAGGQGPYTDEHTLIYANLTEGGVDREAVDKFNETHSDVQIEVRDYFDEDGFSGKDRLLTEIAAGKIPDIIDFGKEGRGFRYTKLPYRQLAQKGYLEDLWPYIESDPELGREGVLEAPLKAAEVNGGLYLAFSAVGVNTLVGAESVVGNRSSWTMEELREAFALMPDESTVLTYYYDRDMMFDDIFNMSLDGYVDWESGQCCFDSDAFRSDLEFINSFPSEVSWASEEELNDKINEQMLTGRQMLDWVWFRYPIDIQELDSIYGSIYGSRASFVGFPVADGSVGSSFSIVGRKLAMSSSCKNKEACWEFLRQMFLPRYNNKTIVRAMYSRYRPSSLRN